MCVCVCVCVCVYLTRKTFLKMKYFSLNQQLGNDRHLLVDDQTLRFLEIQEVFFFS